MDRHFINFVSFIFLIFCSCGICSNLEVKSSASNSNIAKTQLEKIQKQSQHARYGKCWTNALQFLQQGCRNLNDDTQRRIAYSFTKCHLQSSGRHMGDCPENKPISECTSTDNMNDSAFNAYTEFFTHTQEICFHLQSQVWHEATEKTISKLSDNSQMVADRLEKSSDIVKQVIHQQTESLENQMELLKNDRELRSSMEKSVMDVKRSHIETKEIISEQRMLFSEVFDKFADLQKTILGQFSSIYSFGFYIGAVMLAYILTSTTVTQSARIWLFVLITLNAMAERIISEYHIGNLAYIAGSVSTDSYITAELISRHVWICRKISSALGVLLLLIKMIQYKDYNRINNDLLKEIKQELIERKQKDDMFMATIEGFKTTTTRVTHTLKPSLPEVDCANVLENTQDTNSDTLVNESQVTIVKRNNSDEDDSSYVVSNADDSDSSVSSTVTSCSTISNTSSLHSFAHISSNSRRSSTPLRDSFLDASTSSRKSRRRTTSFIREETIVHEGFRVGNYNLRKRPSTPKADNSILSIESPNTFAQRMMSNKRQPSIQYHD